VEERRSRGVEERREVEERRREKEDGEGRRSLSRRPRPSPFVPAVVPAPRWRRR